RASWPGLIGEFLLTVNAVDQPGLPTDLDAVADQVLVRLGLPPKMPEHSRVWSEPLVGTDLVMNLVVDYPNRMCYVTENLVRDSGRPGTHWLERAVANLQARTPPNAFQVMHEESGLLLCNVADAYDSARALLLDVVLSQTGPDGWFVALPGRDQLLI